ncbi:MAG: 50S ribosomal protein L1 [Candidatus Omnitrophica bacterium]|nr:50S ribosomal protein L1 [Candidatus Omnitrophota bacterium]
MRRRSKRYKAAVKTVEPQKVYNLQEAVVLLKNMPHTKFDETVEISLKLGLDPKQTDQLVRGTVSLPHGSGKKVRVVALCKGELENLAKEAGADYVGAGDLIEKIGSGWFEFDAVVAHPTLMREVGKLGKVLGPRGLMPSVKAGTVAEDIPTAIKEIKAGRIEFKMDKQSCLHIAVGKISFEENSISENISTVLEAVERAKPASAKGQYIKSVFISTTMSPGMKLGLNTG